MKSVPNTANITTQPALQSAIEEIASDCSSGAAEILQHAGQVFSLLGVAQSSNESVDQARAAVLDLCVALVRAQPEMSSLLRLASAAAATVARGTSATEVLASAESAAASFIQRASSHARATAANAAELIFDRSTVLSHSRSSTVAEALVQARRGGKSFSVIATESRPACEGRDLARDLAREGVSVTLIADAAAALVIDQIDFVMVGADRITPENVVNKIGTRMIALAARERGRPVFAVCDTMKFIHQDHPGWLRNEAAEGLWQDAPAGVEVLNRYFEPTPLEYFEGVVTERGMLSSEDAAGAARAVSIDPSLLKELERVR